MSFSLYLVHAPILASLCYLLGAAQWWLACLIGVPLSLAVAALFHLLVEQPAQVLARRAGTVGVALGDRVRGRVIARRRTSPTRGPRVVMPSAVLAPRRAGAAAAQRRHGPPAASRGRGTARRCPPRRTRSR